MKDINITTPLTGMHPGIRQDLFDNIRYSSVSGANGTTQGINYSHGFLPKWAFEVVWKNCTASLSVLSKYDFHTTKALFNNPAVWRRYPKGTRRLFGRCMRIFEEAKMLPISCVNPDMDGNRLYMIL